MIRSRVRCRKRRISPVWNILAQALIFTSVDICPPLPSLHPELQSTLVEMSFRQSKWYEPHNLTRVASPNANAYFHKSKNLFPSPLRPLHIMVKTSNFRQSPKSNAPAFTSVQLLCKRSFLTSVKIYFCCCISPGGGRT